MVKRLAGNPREVTVDSYLGLLGWGNSYRLVEKEIGLSTFRDV